MSSISLGQPPVGTSIPVESGQSIVTKAGPWVRWFSLIYNILKGVGPNLALPTFTIATLPDPAVYGEATIIYVSDGLAGQKLRYSDGSSWVIAG